MSIFDEADEKIKKRKQERQKETYTYTKANKSGTSLFDEADRNIDSMRQYRIDTENNYINSLSETDRDAYTRVKESGGIYSSPYLKSGSEGKEKLKYNNADWNALSEEERRHWLDIAEGNLKEEYNKSEWEKLNAEQKQYWIDKAEGKTKSKYQSEAYRKMSPEEQQKWITYAKQHMNGTSNQSAASSDDWKVQYAAKILSDNDNISSVFDLESNGSTLPSTYDLKSEQKWMYLSLPEKIREDINSNVANKYLDRLYSPDEIKMLKAYDASLKNLEKKEANEREEEARIVGSALYGTVVAPAKQMASDVFVSPLAAIATTRSLRNNNGVYDVIDPYETAVQRQAALGQYIGQSINEGLEGNKFAQFAYNTSISTTESAARLAIAKGIGAGLSSVVPAISAEAATGVAMNALMFPSVVNQTATELVEKGVPASQALNAAVMHGVFECLFETVSFDKLDFFDAKPIVADAKTFAKNLLKAGFVEGSEEVATDIANELYDYLTMYDYSDFKAFKDTYEASLGREVTDKEAWGEYKKEFALKLAQSFAGGAVSGLSMGAVTNAQGMGNARAFETKGATVSETDAERMRPVIAELSTHNPNVKNIMDNVQNESAAIQNGAMADIIEQMQDTYLKSIDRAKNATALTNIMDNMNTNLNGLVTEEAINKYNAKMVEFGKEGNASYETFINNRNKGNATTFSDLVYGAGNNRASQEIVKATEEYTEALKSANIANVESEEELKKAVDVVAEKRDILEKRINLAEDIVTKYAETGVAMDDAKVRQYESVLGLENIAKIYSDVKLGQQSLPAIKNKGVVRAASIEEVNAKAPQTVGNISFVDHNTITTSPEYRNQYSMAMILSKMTGQNYAFFKSNRSDGVQNGFYDRNTNTTYWDLNAGYEGAKAAVGETFSHELLHWMRAQNEEQYDKILMFVKNDLGEAFDDFVAERMNKFGYDMNVATEEVVAEACQRMLADSEVFKKYAIADYQGAKTLRDKLYQFINRMRRMLRDVFKGSLNSNVEQAIRDIEGLQKVWDEALAEVLSMEAGIDMETFDDSVVRTSIRTVLSKEEAATVSDMIQKKLGVDKETADKYVKNEQSIASMIFNNLDYLDYVPDDRYEAVKKNSDYPQGTVDLTNLCRKRAIFTQIFDSLQKAFPDKLFNAMDIADIRQVLKDNGYQVACALCFVEDRRQRVGEIAQNFIDRLALSKGKALTIVNSSGETKTLTMTKDLANTDEAKRAGFKYKDVIKVTDDYAPTQYDLVTYEGYKKLSEEHPQIASAFARFNKFLGMSSARLVEGRAEYKREILKYTPKQVERINNKGGLRIFSFSDFEAVHLLDICQVIMDCSAVGLKIQAYTKVPAFAKLVANTGIKLNRSLIPAGRGYEVLKNGKVKLKYDTVEGIDINDPNFFDSSDNPNIGNILVGISNEHIRYAMLDDFVDYIIPFHTNQGKNVLAVKGISLWTNYKEYQRERYADGRKGARDVNIYTDVIDKYHPANKYEFVDAFLKECDRQKKIPRFDQFIDRNADGSYKTVTVNGNEYMYTPGYEKLLLDFKLFDKDGNILPQQTVNPNINMDVAYRILSDEAESVANREQVSEKIIDELEKRYTRYSFRGESSTMTKAEKNNLSVAREMDEKGIESEKIRLATGWFKGYDGKWRNEVDDSNIKVKDVDRNIRRHSLDDVIDHPSLFNAYPFLRKVDIYFVPSNLMHGALGATREGVIDVSKDLEGKAFVNTLMHEVQHMIQNHEGFAKGSSPEYFLYKFKPNEQYDKAKDRLDEVKKKADSLGVLSNAEFYTRWYDSYLKNAKKGKTDVAEMYKNDYERELEIARDRGGEDVVLEYYDALKEYEKRDKNHKLYSPDEAYGLYRNTAGEIEARDVEARINMSEEERRNTRPDIDREDVVFAKYSTRDTEYLNAIGRGDQDAAQRYVDEAAREAGYDIKAWHGSRFVFTSFDPNKRGSNTQTEASKSWFFAGDYDTANSYYPIGVMEQLMKSYPNMYKQSDIDNMRKRGIAGKLYSLYLKMENPLVVDVAGYDYAAHRQNKDAMMEFIEQAEREGRDGIVLYHVKDNNLKPDAEESTVYMFRSPEQAKSADTVTYTDDGEIIPPSERFNKEEKDIRYSFRDKKISSDMSDSQRESVIRNMPPMTVIDYSNEVNYDNDATEPKKYRNDYYKINVGISNKNIDESVVRGRMDAETLQKWRPRIQAALKNAVGLEAHTNRYYFDVDTEEYRNLIGGFIDGENFVPIRFGIKIGKNNKASTHIVLVSEAIKKDKVIGGHSTHPTDVQTGTPNLSEINIAKVLENVNDEYLFEFIPDGILKTDEKIGIKRKLIASSLDEVAKKNNVRYTGFLKRGLDVEAKHMLERGLMNNGFFIDKKSNIARLTSNPNITRSLELRVYDESGREIPFSERIAVTQEELNASRKSDKGNKNGGNKKNKGEGTRFSTRMSMAELDEAYENAYNEYDDDRMQELVDIAAEKAGYKYKAFHHTESNFTVFDLAKARKSMDIQAFFFSADPNAESEYGSKRYDVFLKMETPYIVDSKESAERIPFDLSKENAGVTAREWLLENGYDSVIRKADYYGAEADEYVVLNANQIKSADAMTFDENDELIPLSERFNSYNDDIRYSVRDMANSESEILVNALKNNEALAEGVTKQSVQAYAKAYGELKEMERQSIQYDNDLKKASPSEREAILRKIVRLDRAILKKTTELTEMRNQRVIRDVLIAEWNRRVEDVEWTNELTYQRTREALAKKYGAEISALKTKSTAQKQAIRDRYEINKRKQNIIKKTKALMDMILHGTEKKHIPSILVNPIVEMLDAIDYWTPAENRRVTKKSESMRERFLNFREAVNKYQQQIDEGSELIEYMFDPEFLETVDELVESVKGIENVNDMSVEDIVKLDQTLTELNHLISRGNKMITASHYASLTDAVDATKQTMDARNTLSENTSAKGKILTRLNAGMADSYAFGEYAGEGTREIIDMLSKSFEHKISQVKEAVEFTQDTLKLYKKDLKHWSKDKYDFTLSTTDREGNPNKIKMTIGQMMELYLLSKREQARGHIFGGGIRVEDRKGKYTESVKITEEDVGNIIETLKEIAPGAIEVADKLQKYGATTITGWGNEASNLLYGITKFNDENYWQIRSDSAALKDTENTEKSLNASMYRIQNLGRTKATKKGANNAIYIGDVFDTWSKTIDEMTSYASILPATTDAMRWWNSRVSLDEDTNVRIKKLLESKLGTDMTKVFTETIKALNGGIQGSDSLESLVKTLTGKAKAAAVAGNIRVVLQQPTAYTRAAAVIEPKYLLKALTMKPNAKEAQEHSPIAWHKAQGFYSNGLAPSLRKLVIGDGSFGENLTEKSLWLAGKADDITWGALWNAAKLKVEAENKALQPGSEAYWNEVNKVFSDIINQTQVVDTPLTKSTWMRGNGLGVFFTAFMAEPTKTYSMVMERFDKVLQNPKSKAAWKGFAGVATVFAVNAMVNAMAQALADAARDDDKEKDYFEKYKEKYEEDVRDNINPLTYIPVVKDILSMYKGYNNNNLAMQAAQNSVYAVQEIQKISQGKSKKTLFGQAETIAKAISSWTGIPVGNVMRTLNSMGNVMGIDLFRRKKYTNKELARNIVLSVQEGNIEDADKYMSDLLANVGNEKATTYITDYLANNSEQIDYWAQRYMDDPTVLDEAAEAMPYFSSEAVTKAIRKSVNADATSDDEKIKTSTIGNTEYSSDDINRMLEKGNINKAQEIINEVNEGYAKAGSNSTAKSVITSYWKPKYIAASSTEKDKILKMLYKLKNNGKQMYSAKDIEKWK